MNILFATQDLQRIQGLEKLLPQLAIACINRNELANQMETLVEHFFCLEDHQDVSDIFSTSQLLQSEHTENFVNNIFKNSKAKILVFKNSPKLERLAEANNWELLNNPSSFNKTFEDKISFVEECKKSGVRIPKTIVAKLKDKSYEELKESLGDKFVVQFRRGHAGQSTFFIDSEEDWKELMQAKSEHSAKISQTIHGPTLTYNVCIHKDGVDYSNLMYQISNQPKFNQFRGGTCGVDTIYAEQFAEHEDAIKEIAGKFIAQLQKEGYKGFLGLDFVLDSSNEVFLIECNARLTANLALNTMLEMNTGAPVLILSHIQEFIGDLDPNKKEKTDLKGGSLFILRNITKLPMRIRTALESGTYSLGTDGSTNKVSDNLDLAKCAKNEFVLEVESKKKVINPGMKYASILAPFSVLEDDGQLKTFLAELNEKFNLATIYILPKDFWEGQFGTAKQDCIDMLRKPFADMSKLNDRARTRNRQSQALKDEGTFQILGEYEGCYLIRKWDKTHGWVDKNDIEKTETKNEKYELAQTRSANPDAEKITKFFEKYSNTPYLWGGLSPQGIDCSGFTQRYFLELFNVGLPKHSLDQMNCGKSVSKEELKDHDLIFLRHKETDRSHVGVYYDGLFTHSSFTKNSIQKEPIEEKGLLENYHMLGCQRII